MRAIPLGFRCFTACVAAALALPPSPVVADASDTAPPTRDPDTLALPPVDAMIVAGASAVGDVTLDDLRGGFESGGLQMSFGIARVVYVNGQLASVTSVNVSDLGRLSGGRADTGTAIPPGTSLALIQNGPGNTFAAELSSSALATVIQNTLDNQQIRAETTITATVNSAEMARQLRLEQTLRDSQALFR